MGDQQSNSLTLIGSDDGVAFWSLKGKYTDKATSSIVVDFSPKGGPAGLNGKVDSTGITWEDGNKWSKVDHL